MRRVREACWRLSDLAAWPLENLCQALRGRGLDRRPGAPPIFIIGPPRSGTTLLYQIMVTALRTAYFTNFVARFPHAPLLALQVSRRLLDADRCGAFRSHHGMTQGWAGPHEGGDFWYRWFPRGLHVYVGPGELPPEKLQHLRTTVTRLAAAAARPMLFKNTYNTMRVAPLLEAFPRAALLVCRRDPVDTAQSILNSRVRTRGRKEGWWALPPREIDGLLDHPYWDQVVEQVYYSYKQIDADRALAPAQFLDVDYATLCEDPAGTLARITRFLTERRIPVERRADALPEGFRPSRGQQVDNDDYARIRAKVKELWGE